MSATDSREIARRLLARSNSASSAAPAALGVGGTSSAQSAKPDRSFADHPDVIQAKQLSQTLDRVFASSDLPNPFFAPRAGKAGATARFRGLDLINFGSYNYLGLSADPRVLEAAKAAIDTYGMSTSASRIVAGEIPLYGELEQELATVYGVDDAVVTASGYATNAALVGFLLKPGDLAVCDSLVHSSVVSGTKWSGCKRINFRHNDPDSLDSILRMSRSSFERALVVIEGHYSMDGDLPPLPDLIEVARRYDCSIMIDEAHSFGVLGEHGFGIREHFGLDGDAVDIWMGTLSKALGSTGGFVAANADLVRGLRLSAPGISMFTNGPLPAAIAGAQASLRILHAEPERALRVQRNGHLFHSLATEYGFDTGSSQGTPIVPIIMHTTERAALASTRMMQEGINATAITYPSVPAGEERLRFFLSSEHTEEQMNHALATLRKVVDQL